MANDLDLPLLRVFCAVFETGSVTRAAARMELSQPAISYALGRLRNSLADPLFIRASGGMAPTPAAKRIYGHISAGIALLDSVLLPDQFDPQHTARTFRIALSDIGELTFAPAIVAALQTEAPHVTLECKQVSRRDIPQALDHGTIDFAIGNLPEICALTAIASTFRETYVCVHRRDHPAIAKRLTRRSYEQAQHILFPSSFSGHDDIVEGALHAHGVHRKAGLRASHFTSVPDVIANTDLLATVPSRVAKRFAETHGLIVQRLPVIVPHFDVRIHWSKRHEGNEGHRWLRERLIQWLRAL